MDTLTTNPAIVHSGGQWPQASTRTHRTVAYP
jgi:hypothetical protein